MEGGGVQGCVGKLKSMTLHGKVQFGHVFKKRYSKMKSGGKEGYSSSM